MEKFGRKVDYFGLRAKGDFIDIGYVILGVWGHLFTIKESTVS